MKVLQQKCALHMLDKKDMKILALLSLVIFLSWWGWGYASLLPTQELAVVPPIIHVDIVRPSCFARTVSFLMQALSIFCRMSDAERLGSHQHVDIAKHKQNALTRLKIKSLTLASCAIVTPAPSGLQDLFLQSRRLQCMAVQRACPSVLVQSF